MSESFFPVIDGVSNVVANIAEQIGYRGSRALVAAPKQAGSDDGRFPYPVLRYQSLDMQKTFGYMAGIPFSPALCRRLRREKTELLHCHTPWASMILARQLREALDIPVIYTCHTRFEIAIENTIRTEHWRREAIRSYLQNVSGADEVWVLSRAAGEKLRQFGYQGPTCIMQNGIGLEKGRALPLQIEAAAAGFDLPASLPLYLYVGRLVWHKGLKITLDALAELRHSGLDFRAVLIGTGADEAEIKAYTAEAGLSDRVFFPGLIRDRETLRAWYSRADLFVFPSTFDTSGLVVHEAAACGLPSVLIEGSCAAENVIDGVNGFLTEENSHALSAKLTQLYLQRDCLRRVGAQAASDLYVSWQSAAANMLSRYETVLERYRSGTSTSKRRKNKIIAVSGAAMGALSRLPLPGRLSDGLC